MIVIVHVIDVLCNKY